jgi:hypothetical protein
VDLSDPAVTQQNSSSCKRRKALYTAVALKISNRKKRKRMGKVGIARRSVADSGGQCPPTPVNMQT